MASVTFPTALGGDGKTYSDDADPDTGLDGLGYITRLVPLFKNGLAMTAYTAQYAAKIDAAAANADRAEDARGYVEAVADAYHVNLLEQFKQKATLVLDFERGIYRVDDGTLTQTTDAADVIDIPRSTPKTVPGSNGLLAESSGGTIARCWENGVPKGIVTNRALTNKVLMSNTLSSSEWFSQNVTPSVSDVVFSRDGRALNKVTQNTGTGVHLVQQIFTDSYEGYWISFIAKAGAMKRLRIRTTTSANHGLTIDLSNGNLVTQGSQVSRISVNKLQGGLYKVVFRSSTVGRILFYPEDASGNINYTGDGFSDLYIGAVSVSKSRPLEYVESGGSEVSSQNDCPVLSLQNNRFNPYDFTWYFEYTNYNLSSDTFSICGSSFLNSFNLLAVFSAGATPRLDLRSLAGGDWIPIPGYDVDNEYGKTQKIVITYSGEDLTVRMFWNGQLRVEQPEVVGFSDVGGLVFGSRRPAVSGFTSETIFSEFFSLSYAITNSEAEELTAQ